MWWPSTNFLDSFMCYYFLSTPTRVDVVGGVWERKIQCRVYETIIQVVHSDDIVCGGHWESLDEWVNMLSVLLLSTEFSHSRILISTIFISKTDVECARMLSAQTLMLARAIPQQQSIPDAVNRPSVILLLLNSCFVYIIICLARHMKSKAKQASK